jgi:hypothetical protein
MLLTLLMILLTLLLTLLTPFSGYPGAAEAEEHASGGPRYAIRS